MIDSTATNDSKHSPGVIMQVMKSTAKDDSYSETDLLKDLKNGNEKAMRAIYDMYWEKLFRSSYSVLEDEDICRDVVQEIFIDLWVRRSKLNIENLRAFLYQAVRNRVAKHIRKIKLKEKHKVAIKNLYVKETGADTMYEFKELNQSIQLSLNRLPERCHEVFLLSRYEYKSNSEIAEKLNISKRTVETHISKAIKHLRSTLTSFVLMFAQIISHL
ncbi:MAG: RNA polymerase sigma-70 factor [Cyclobacteriaceae bacterium]